MPHLNLPLPLQLLVQPLQLHDVLHHFALHLGEIEVNVDQALLCRGVEAEDPAYHNDRDANRHCDANEHCDLAHRAAAAR